MAISNENAKTPPAQGRSNGSHNESASGANSRIKETALLILCLAIVFLFPPIILIFNKPTSIFGIPISAAYLFFIWLLMILANALTARRLEDTTR